MWMVPPAGMCIEHLREEHAEIHMIIGAMRKESMLPTLLGLARVNCIDAQGIVQRHDDLAWEMTRRGLMHHTEILQPFRIPPELADARVDWKAAARVLASRCPECRARLMEVLRDSKNQRGSDPPVSWEMPDL